MSLPFTTRLFRSSVFMGFAALLLPLNMIFGPAATNPESEPGETTVASSSDDMRATVSHSQRIHFTENRGQVIDTDGNLRPDILYTADAGGVRLYFTAKGVSYVFSRDDAEEQQISEATGDAIHRDSFDRDDQPQKVTTYRMDLELVGSNQDVRISAERELFGYDNFYLAHCPDGITYVKSYGTLVYENVYDNIDMVWTADAMGTKYEYIVHPGGKVSDIRMMYQGSDLVCPSTSATEIITPLGGIREYAVVSWQDGIGCIPTVFAIRGDTTGFHVDPYNAAQPLLIDPWATYYGGSAYDEAFCLITDAVGNSYIAGISRSSNFPVQNAVQSTCSGNADAVIVKLNANGSRMWATYYGGTAYDTGDCIALDGQANPVIAGCTLSTDFPVHNSQQPANGGLRDLIAVKLSTNGVRQWATYYGGSSNEYSHAVVVDGNGSTTISGRTESSDFPVQNAQQPTFAGGPEDIFLLKLSSIGARQWATYCGGSLRERCRGIAVDASNNVILAGWSFSTDFPVLNAQQPTLAGACDAVLQRYSVNGVLQWSTYCGGSGSDLAQDVVLDAAGYMYICGYTSSTDFPVLLPQQSSLAGIEDVFLMKLNNNGLTQWASYYGGALPERANAIVIDGSGNLAVCGVTESTDFPVLNAEQPAIGGNKDAFILKTNNNGTVIWSTFYGGNDIDKGWGIAAGSSGAILVAGLTYSTNFPLYNPMQSTNASNGDWFIISLNSSGRVPVRLVNFSAQESDGVVRLHWRTDVEESNHGFEIQRKQLSSKLWEVIGFVPGSGTASAPNTYSFTDGLTDLGANEGALLYRLKQIDFDGSFEYSPIASVAVGNVPKTSALHHPYPNPARDHLFIPFSLPVESPVSIRIYSTAGQELLSVRESQFFASGSHALLVRTAGLPTGTYVIEFKAGIHIESRRIVITE